MIRAGQVLVCLRDFPLMGRTFAKGEVFPMGRYWKVASRLARLRMIGVLTNHPTSNPGPASPVSFPPGEAGPNPNPSTTSDGKAKLCTVHRGAGRWVVMDTKGNQVHEGTLTKAEAQALAGGSEG